MYSLFTSFIFSSFISIIFSTGAHIGGLLISLQNTDKTIRDQGVLINEFTNNKIEEQQELEDLKEFKKEMKMQFDQLKQEMQGIVAEMKEMKEDKENKDKEEIILVKNNDKTNQEIQDKKIEAIIEEQKKLQIELNNQNILINDMKLENEETINVLKEEIKDENNLHTSILHERIDVAKDAMLSELNKYKESLSTIQNEIEIIDKHISTVQFSWRIKMEDLWKNISSDNVTIKGKTFRAELRLGNGNSLDYYGVYLYANKDSLLDTPCTVKYSMELLSENQEKNKNIYCTFENIFTTENDAWGEAKYVKAEHLRSGQYLKDGFVTITVDIAVIE